MTKTIRLRAAAILLFPLLAFGTAHASEVTGTFGTSGTANPPGNGSGSQSEVEGNFGTGGGNGNGLAGTVVGGAPDGGESGLSGSVRGGSSGGGYRRAVAAEGGSEASPIAQFFGTGGGSDEDIDATDGTQAEDQVAAALGGSNSLLAAVGDALSFGTGNAWLMIVTVAAILFVIGYGVSTALSSREPDGTDTSDF